MPFSTCVLCEWSSLLVFTPVAAMFLFLATRMFPHSGPIPEIGGVRREPEQMGQCAQGGA